MPFELDQVMQLGHDLIGLKCYILATGTILFYDHLLTLADEIRYFWPGKKKWTFWLFVFNRYFPMTYQFWQLALSASYGPHFNVGVCAKTAWYPVFAFVICTFLAQVVLTVRTYAVTMGKISITIGFAVVTASQFVFGLYSSILIAREGAQPFPQIPLDAYHFCMFVPHRTCHLIYAVISLLYDFLAFSLIVFSAAKSRLPGVKIPSILEVITRDAMQYFLVIFTGHLVLAMTLAFAQEPMQFFPAPGLLVYFPVMVSRMMLSLRKATDPGRGDWSLADPVDPSLKSMVFVRPQSTYKVHTNEGRDDEPSDV